MRRFNAAAWVALVSHALAWGAFLWFMFSPDGYTGVKITPGRPGEPPGPSTVIHASFLSVNGLRAIPILVIPVAITALLLVLAISNRNGRYAPVIAWFLVATLLVFCFLGMFSLGLFYMPATLVALVTAILLSRQHPEATAL